MKTKSTNTKSRGVTAVQALALLAISAGAIKMIQDRCIISRVDTKENLRRCYHKILVAINNWPEAKKTMVHTTEEIGEALHEWSKIEYTITDRNRAAVLLMVCERALLDLYDRLNTKLPRSLIRGILEPLQGAWKVEGKDGAMFSVHEEAKVMVEQLKTILKW